MAPRGQKKRKAGDAARPAEAQRQRQRRAAPSPAAAPQQRGGSLLLARLDDDLLHEVLRRAVAGGDADAGAAAARRALRLTCRRVRTIVDARATLKVGVSYVRAAGDYENGAAVALLERLAAAAPRFASAEALGVELLAAAYDEEDGLYHLQESMVRDAFAALVAAAQR